MSVKSDLLQMGMKKRRMLYMDIVEALGDRRKEKEDLDKPVVTQLWFGTFDTPHQ